MEIAAWTISGYTDAGCGPCRPAWHAGEEIVTKYAVIKVGARQYRVEEGEYLLVDRQPYAEGEIFEPSVLLIGGDGNASFGDGLGSAAVKVKILEHLRGPKVIIGKHRRRTGYRRRNGFRAELTRIQIEKIGAVRKKKAKATTATSKAAG